MNIWKCQILLIYFGFVRDGKILVNLKKVVFDVYWKNFGSTNNLWNDFIIKELRESTDARLVIVIVVIPQINTSNQ